MCSLNLQTREKILDDQEKVRINWEFNQNEANDKIVKTPTVAKPQGIRNYNNTCFFNAIIQMILCITGIDFRIAA